MPNVVGGDVVADVVEQGGDDGLLVGAVVVGQRRRLKGVDVAVDLIAALHGLQLLEQGEDLVEKVLVGLGRGALKERIVLGRASVHAREADGPGVRLSRRHLTPPALPGALTVPPLGDFDDRARGLELLLRLVGGVFGTAS